MKRRWFEIVLAAVGIASLSKAGWDLCRYQHFQNQPLSRPLATPSSASQAIFEGAANKHAVIGHIAIPRLRLLAAMVEGDDEESLSLAVGHMQGTAPLGSKGNAVVAGHRDTAFWPLRNVRKGDRILVSTDKRYVYAVEQTKIVDPDDTRALRDANNAVLTLVTCYPFRHVGPAPKRFIVVAKLLHSQNEGMGHQ